MNDKTLGYAIMVFTILIMVGYFAWAFEPNLNIQWLAPYADWAYKLPILLAVYLMLFIILWIGYTMATTPPPIPLESPLDLEKETEQKEEKPSP